VPDLPARLTLGQYPALLEELPRFRAALGAGPRIFIKRDDLAGPGFGGNKVRKLEYVLADAISRRADLVITTGGETSNHWHKS
jgi:L-cysteate sulfo-lyase